MSLSEIRIFNEAGLNAFDHVLNQMENSGTFISLESIVHSNELTTKISSQQVIHVIDFESRMECGKYFYELFENIKLELQSAGVDTVTDKGLWSWISAFWGEVLLRNSGDRFYVGNRARYILESGAFRDYRHLLAGPYSLYKASNLNPENIEIAMTKKVTQDNPFFEQIASRREIVSNPAALQIIRSYYFDEINNCGYDQAARGSLPGNLARFGSVYSQLAVNFDLRSMSQEEISGLLPNEFLLWRQGNPPAVKKRAKSKIKKAGKRKASKRQTKRSV